MEEGREEGRKSVQVYGCLAQHCLLDYLTILAIKTKPLVHGADLSAF